MQPERAGEDVGQGIAGNIVTGRAQAAGDQDQLAGSA